MTEFNPEDEEIDLEDINLHEDPPEEGVRRHIDGAQDDNATDEFEEGEALGDDLAEPNPKEEPNA